MKPQLQTPIYDTAGGDVQLLVHLINNALLQVSINLEPLSAVSVPIFTDVLSEYVFQSAEVYNLLSHVKTHKSSGPDEIPNWFLKEFVFAIADPMCLSVVGWCQISGRDKCNNVIQNQTYRNPSAMTFDPFRLLRVCDVELIT